MAGVAIETPEFIEQIRQSIAEHVKPLSDRIAEQSQKITALEQQAAELQKPVKKASQLFGGGAPAVRQGESALTSRGYRFSSLMRACADGDWANAKVELEVSKRLRESYGALTGESKGILAPLGGIHLQRMDSDLAGEISQMVRQGVSGADPGQMQRYMQSAGIYDDTNLGALLGSVQQGEMIDLLRSKEIFSRAGATEFTLPPNGRIQFPKWTKDFDAYWVGEKRPIPETEAGTGMLNMVARKLAAITTWSNELLRFSTPSTEALIRNALAYAMAKRVDVSFLNGVESEVAPRGLLNTEGIVKRIAGVVGTDGDTLQPRDTAMLIAQIAEGDVDTDSMSVFMRPLLLADVSTRRADAVNEGDGKGPLLFPYTEKDGISKLSRATVYETTRVPNDRAKGAGANLTLVLAGAFSEFLIGRVGVMEFTPNSLSDTNFVNDMTSLRVIQHIDGKARRPEAFGIIDKLLSTV